MLKERPAGPNTGLMLLWVGGAGTGQRSIEGSLRVTRAQKSGIGKIGSCAGVVGAMSLSWMAMADAQKLKFPRALTFKDILESTKVNEIVAARDR